MEFTTEPYTVESIAKIKTGYKTLSFRFTHDALVKLTEKFVFDKLCEYITYIWFDTQEEKQIKLCARIGDSFEHEMVHQLYLSVDDYNNLKPFFPSFTDTYRTDDIREILTYLCKL
jgi:hypothetical protein